MSEFVFCLFDGLCVVEMGQFFVGFFCGIFFGYYGVEVIKIELKIGDLICIWCEMCNGQLFWWLLLVCNKKSVMLNLCKDEGCVIVCCFIEQVDVFIENFCLGIFEKWGFDFEDLQKENFDFIVVCILGYGQIGFYVLCFGYVLVCEGFGGFCYVNGVFGE